MNGLLRIDKNDESQRTNHVGGLFEIDDRIEGTKK